MTRLCAVAVAVILLTLAGMPHAVAAPGIPDIDSLIDDSGPLPATPADLGDIPELLFTTPSGLVCKKTLAKVVHDVTCTGNMPGAPAGTQTVNLSTVYANAAGPARFLSTPPQRFFGDISGQTPVLIPVGHKIVFWAFSPTVSLACGVPSEAALVCVLRGVEFTDNDPPVTHGFMIAAPQSQVF
ncbi:hypothetical protein A5784_28970 [Mycobacterium sp. 852013-50091_SCH5140682]|uniref:hypothetical protein n=1 Tax=Mycobacterium sp. 852013-50091_SCH5140682 TaxID=1834109 RepID=UPI0007E9F908|nr:hypothetical protein [Mycobacterium sp. 852013-50091_SCH5140682]OBC15090.1 hypothetical protein A5784_28970 [Mycobacterium sp. 852013-50091_SCH5140682]